jgi:hypothetical protein
MGCYLKKGIWSHTSLSRPGCWSTSSNIARRKQGKRRVGSAQWGTNGRELSRVQWGLQQQQLI